MKLQRFVLIGGGLFLALASLARAHADEHAPRVPLLPKYQQECASCHVAFPPGLLPATSWQRLIGSLSRHFGTDASLDPATVTELAGWLKANAATRPRVAEAPPEDRITRSAWFVREHRELPAATWSRPAIRSASNCSACHEGAAQGRFDERDIRIPG